MCPGKQKHVDPIEHISFCYNKKSAEDGKHDEKHSRDLLEAIMRPTCLVKEELQPIKVFKAFINEDEVKLANHPMPAGEIAQPYI